MPNLLGLSKFWKSKFSARIIHQMCFQFGNLRLLTFVALKRSVHSFPHEINFYWSVCALVFMNPSNAHPLIMHCFDSYEITQKGFVVVVYLVDCYFAN